ncbi:MAG TPA: hypothetical protein V6C91_09965, partial [Coleofasciculaceae cyanobacterium]
RSEVQLKVRVTPKKGGDGYYENWRLKIEQGWKFSADRYDSIKDENGNPVKDDKNRLSWEYRYSVENEDGLSHIERRALNTVKAAEGREKPYSREIFVLPNFTGGLKLDDVRACSSFFMEMDSLSLEEQMEKINAFALVTGLTPTVVVFSGSKSYHVYWVLDEPLTDFEQWQRIQEKLIVVFTSDKTITNRNREMRLPSMPRFKNEQWTRQHLVFASGKRYSAKQFEDALDSLGYFPNFSREHWEFYGTVRGAGETEERDFSKLARIFTLTTEQVAEEKRQLLAANASARATELDNELAVQQHNATAVQRVAAPKVTYSGGSAIVDLFDLLPQATQAWIKNGLAKGCGGRNRYGLKVGQSISYTIRALDRLNIQYNGSGLDLLREYYQNCSPYDQNLVNDAERQWHNCEGYTSGGGNPSEDSRIEKRHFWLLWKIDKDEAKKLYGERFLDKYKRACNNTAPVPAPTQSADSATAPAPQDPLEAYKAKVAEVQKHLTSLGIKAGENVELLEFKSRFIPNEYLQKVLSSCILCLKAYMGQGKTTFIRAIVNELFPKRPVVLVSSTITLGEALCSALNKDKDGKPVGNQIYWRNDLEDLKSEDKKSFIDQNFFLRYETSRIGLCAESLHRLIGRKNKNLILVLDEVVSVLRNLMLGSTCNRFGKRPFNIQGLTDLLKNAKENNVMVILADANLSNVELDFFKRLCPDLPVVGIVSQQLPPAWEVVEYRAERESGEGSDKDRQMAKAAIFNRITELLELGENLAIPCDSQDLGVHLEQELLAKFTGIPIIRIDSETSGNDTIKSFIQDIDKSIAQLQPRVLIYSPSLGQGASIQASKEYVDTYQQLKAVKAQNNGDSEDIFERDELKNIGKNWESLTPYFNRVIGINTHLTPFSFRQKLGRVRHPVPREYWCGEDMPITGCKSPLPSEQIKYWLQSDELTLETIRTARKNAGGDTADSEAILSQFQELVRKILEGQSPEMNAVAELRARECHQARDRASQLRSQLQAEGHSYKEVRFCDEGFAGDLDTSFRDSVKDRREKAKELHAQKAVTPYLQHESEVIYETIPEQIAESLENKKAALTKDEEIQLERYRLEREYPGFIGELRKLQSEGFLNLKDFYLNEIINNKKEWLKSVTRHWEYQHRNELAGDDWEAFEKRYKNYKAASVVCLQDARERSGFYSFVADWGVLELFSFDEEVCRTDSKVIEFLKKSRTKKYNEKIRLYFNGKTAPSKQNEDRKTITWFNDILGFFGLTLALTQKTETKRYYKLDFSPTDKQSKIIRKSLENCLDEKRLKRLTSKESSAGITPLYSYIKTASDASQKKHTTAVLQTTEQKHAQCELDFSPSGASVGNTTPP